MGSGQPVSIPTMVNLPSFGHPQLPTPTGFTGGIAYGPENVASVIAWDVNPRTSGAVMGTFLEGRMSLPALLANGSDCFNDVTETCVGPIAPVRRQFSCQGTGCSVEIACDQTTECVSSVGIFAFAPPSGARALLPSRRIKFASVVTSIPPGTSAIVKPRLTKRGKAIFRANRKKRIAGVMSIRNATTGTLVTNVSVKIKLK